MTSTRSTLDVASTRTVARNRVTLRFHSDDGHEYLYDDQTGSILPWSPVREAVLSSLLSGSLDQRRPDLEALYGVGPVLSAHTFLAHWTKDYGAFARVGEAGCSVPAPDPAQLEAHVRSTTFELLLIVTEDCNLRCTYCALSELYPLNRVRTHSRMTRETARAALDWYRDLVSDQIARNPRKRFGLSFYGGDPLMNAAVVRHTLEYARERHAGLFLPVMTTNGTLLTPRNVEMLVEHDVQLAISVDGPREEHDRTRVDSKGRGSLDKVLANLRWIREHHPGYFVDKLTTVSVYDWATDLEAVERFFDENADLIPRSVFVNQVAPYNTDYYDRFTAEDRSRMEAARVRLRERYKQAKVDGEPSSNFMTALVGMPIALGLLRGRSQDVRPDFVPFTGTCVPGDKIAVHVDGKLDMCERVNGSYPLGWLDRGGIDFERLRDIVVRYREQVMTACYKCPATKLCNVCFALTEKGEGWAKNPSQCAGTIQDARQKLGDYVTIRERNPRADFSFDTDVSYLEKRLLYGY